MKWSDKAMKELFTNNLTIPEYQRSFSWNEDNIEDFFTDLTKFISRNDEYYLFGQIIIHHEDSVNYIVDGQQRITTSTIFLCAIRDIIKDRKYDLDSLRTNIFNVIGFSDDGYRLTSGQDNKEFFMNYIQGANHNYKTQHETDKKIQSAYEQLRFRIEGYIGDDEHSLNKLKTLANRFLDGFHVSYVETESLSQAFTVFETLNARGTPLEAPDLLKNHFFSRLDKNHEYIKNNWKRMVDKISAAMGSNATTQFIKYYWNSFNDFVREKELFETISKIPDSRLYSFLSGMFESVDLYLEVVKPRYQSEMFSRDIVDRLMNLKQFGASSFCPLIMALIKTDNEDAILDTVKAIETQILRNQVIGKKTANKNERKYSEWALEISNRRKMPEKVVGEIYSSTDSDEDVSTSFHKFSPKEGIGKLLLIEIYNSSHVETKITDRGKDVHLEHIMPKKRGDWPIEEGIWKEYHVRFGNMALLNGKKNIQISNSLFDVKKKKYLESNIDDTRQIAEKEKWGVEEIEERQDMLLKKVLERWPKLITGFISLDPFMK